MSNILNRLFIGDLGLQDVENHNLVHVIIELLVYVLTRAAGCVHSYFKFGTALIQDDQDATWQGQKPTKTLQNPTIVTFR